ncbi:hypothetical protein NE237_009096 [Protea cynaroides]|uniref:EF-hand domain-containing protein n=1 Tax=Protea cynaroides TaxID=273540 RepID=A0A9Q0KXN9_9MAGN|nr:hypothetical protein NE237_009096 [Protea cynaroides]
MAQLLNQEMQIFLQKFDTDGDGRISMDEIESFLKQNGNRNTAVSGANGAMTAIDLDGNGYIDGPEEIAAFMKCFVGDVISALANFIAISSGPSMYPLPSKSILCHGTVGSNGSVPIAIFLEEALDLIHAYTTVTIGVEFLQKNLHLLVEKLSHVSFARVVLNSKVKS